MPLSFQSWALHSGFTEEKSHQRSDVEHISIPSLASRIREEGRPVIFEGVRCSGKTYAAKRVSDLINWDYYTIGVAIKERKELIGKYSPGNAGAADYGSMNLSISQGHVFAMDMLAQRQQKNLIMDRCILSSFWFQGLVEPTHWQTFLKIENAVPVR